ncbi:MAG: poly-beta-1,6-N-acetyl-D-glucosamine N-deacetylase PgaB [Woeseia sp.]
MEILKPLLLSLMVFASSASSETLPYRVIAYHDVRDDVAEDYDPDQYAVSTSKLIEQFTWLRDNGFHPVTIDQLVAATRGEQPLPDRAVLLTFDDGLASVYTHVYPLLKLFNYPAVVSIVTNWIESDALVDYAGKKLNRNDFLTRAQLREMHESGLVEIASHSHDLHRGVRGNPQGSMQPAAVTRIFGSTGYESEAAYRQRIDSDLSDSVRNLREITGESPRVIVWPYGAFTEISEDIAAQRGLTFSLTLSPISVVNGSRVRLGRYLLSANPELYRFSFQLRAEPAAPLIRFAQIDLDSIYDPDPAQQNRNLDRMLDQIKALKISHVFLKAFADDDSDGSAIAAYFPNRHLPVREDLFNFVSWQLKTRAEVSVFAWLPMLSFKGDAFDPDWLVLENLDGEIRADPASEPRLSPFSKAARNRIAEVYEDMAAYSHVDGIFFHDDARLSNLEDYSAAGRAKFLDKFSREMSQEILSEDSALRREWGKLKAQALIDLSDELLARARQFQPNLKSARSIFSSAVLDESGIEYLAQDLDAFIGAYDFAVLLAMPAMGDAQNQEHFYRELIAAVARREAGLDRTLFDLLTYERERSTPIPDAQLSSTMRWLQSLGVRNLGYYPNDFISGRADLNQIRLGISLADDFSGAGQ